MCNIKEFIDMNEKDFDSFFNILDNSFPQNERRDYPSQKALLSVGKYRPFVFKENDEVLALMATWEFADFAYVEHLAVDNKLRGKGVGTELIKNYLNKCDKKVFLEVEPPNCETSKKRVSFYEKLGFCFNDFYYLQQPLNPGDSPFRLNIMSYPESIGEKEFDKYKKDIYKDVYGVELQEQ